MPITTDAIGRQTDISPHGSKSAEGKAKRISTIFINHDQGIDHITLTLAHLLSLGITNQGVNIDLFEGNFLHEAQPHHHHPSYPEKQNIKTRNQTAGGIKFL